MCLDKVNGYLLLDDADKISTIKKRLQYGQYALWGLLMIGVIIYFGIQDAANPLNRYSVFEENPYILPELAFCGPNVSGDITLIHSIYGVFDKIPNEYIIPPDDNSRDCNGIPCKCGRYPEGSLSTRDQSIFNVHVQWITNSPAPVIGVIADKMLYWYDAESVIMAGFSKSYIDEYGESTRLDSFSLSVVAYNYNNNNEFLFQLRIPSLLVTHTQFETPAMLARRIVTDSFSLFSLIGTGSTVLFATIITRLYFKSRASRTAFIDHPIRESVLQIITEKGEGKALIGLKGPRMSFG